MLTNDPVALHDQFKLDVALRLFKRQTYPMGHGQQQIDIGAGKGFGTAATKQEDALGGVIAAHWQADHGFDPKFTQLAVDFRVGGRLVRQDRGLGTNHGLYMSLLLVRKRQLQHILRQADGRQRRECPCSSRVEKDDHIGAKQLRQHGEDPVEHQRQRSRFTEDGQQTGQAGSIAHRLPRGPQGAVPGHTQTDGMIHGESRRESNNIRVHGFFP